MRSTIRQRLVKYFIINGERIPINVAYNYFEVKGKVTEEEGRFEGRLKYEFKGPLLGVHVTL
jgi:hypothetical protein